MLAARGGTSLGEAPARAWEHGRFDAPYLRDALLAAGALCETLETATYWSNIAALKAAVTDALTDRAGRIRHGRRSCCATSRTSTRPARRCTSPSSPAQRGSNLDLAQWRAAKTAACDAIVRTGGTITHHHAVGADHRPWMTRRDRRAGRAGAARGQGRLDPAGILNPGKLIP